MKINKNTPRTIKLLSLIGSCMCFTFAVIYAFLKLYVLSIFMLSVISIICICIQFYLVYQIKYK